MSENNQATFNFESALKQLEQIVDKMEAGNLSLEESLKAFETGIKLTKDCQQALDQAEQKVKILIKENPSIAQGLHLDSDANKDPDANGQ